MVNVQNTSSQKKILLSPLSPTMYERTNDIATFVVTRYSDSAPTQHGIQLQLYLLRNGGQGVDYTLPASITVTRAM